MTSIAAALCGSIPSIDPELMLFGPNIESWFPVEQVRKIVQIGFKQFKYPLPRKMAGFHEYMVFPLMALDPGMLLLNRKQSYVIILRVLKNGSPWIGEKNVEAELVRAGSFHPDSGLFRRSPRSLPGGRS